MLNAGLFEEELDALKKDFEHGAFIYSDLAVNFTAVSTSHFREQQRLGTHGVYIVREQSSGEILYVGKGGTIEREGQFQKQDILKRLNNSKDNVPANQWFRSLVEEKGPLVVEYIILATTPKSPALVEALLLQAHLNEYGRLPYRNNEF